MKKLESLSIFFPFFNDEGTVEEAITQAFAIGKQVSESIEVIAIHGGNSKDKTWNKILEMKKRHRYLKVINKVDNAVGYAVIVEGFKVATKDWVFYTDGDLQYDLKELPLLVKIALKDKHDVVNGYKVKRGDHFHRVLLGNIYQSLSHFIFQLPIRDVDCDFRLIKRSYLVNVTLNASHAAVLPELIFKLKRAGAKFSEIPVSHHSRKYGKSNYSWHQLTWEKISGDAKLYFEIQKLKQNQGRSHS